VLYYESDARADIVLSTLWDKKKGFFTDFPFEYSDEWKLRAEYEKQYEQDLMHKRISVRMIAI
jgi:hypothetical protein